MLLHPVWHCMPVCGQQAATETFSVVCVQDGRSLLTLQLYQCDWDYYSDIFMCCCRTVWCLVFGVLGVEWCGRWCCWSQTTLSIWQLRSADMPIWFLIYCSLRAWHSMWWNDNLSGHNLLNPWLGRRSSPKNTFYIGNHFCIIKHCAILSAGCRVARLLCLSVSEDTSLSSWKGNMWCMGYCSTHQWLNITIGVSNSSIPGDILASVRAVQALSFLSAPLWVRPHNIN